MLASSPRAEKSKQLLLAQRNRLVLLLNRILLRLISPPPSSHTLHNVLSQFLHLLMSEELVGG